jgi:hypothetical protein
LRETLIVDDARKARGASTAAVFVAFSSTGNVLAATSELLNGTRTYSEADAPPPMQRDALSDAVKV